MHTYFSGFIVIKGRQIYCKILTQQINPRHRPFLLCIPGGPGFGLLAVEMTVKQWEEIAQKNKSKMPNIILFDPPGCGLSEKALNPEDEYCMDNYNAIAAGVVEYVKATLCPHRQLDLRIYGLSIGGMVAMNLPLIRPDWLHEDSKIRITQIITNALRNGAYDIEYTRHYIEQHFPDNPEIKTAIEKLLTGSFVDQDDYLNNFVFKLTQLQAEDFSKTPFRVFTTPLIALMKLGSFLGKKMGTATDKLDYLLDGLTGRSLDVLNQFFKTQFNGANIIENVRHNLASYQRLQLMMISYENDFLVNPQTSTNIHALLPETSADIMLQGNWHSTLNESEPAKSLIDQMLADLISQGGIAEKLLNDNAVIAHHSVTDNTRFALEKFAVRDYSSTQQMVFAIGGTFEYQPLDVEDDDFGPSNDIVVDVSDSPIAEDQPAKTLKCYPVSMYY